MLRLRSIDRFRPYLIGLFLVLPAIRAAVWMWLTWNNPSPSKEAMVQGFIIPFIPMLMAW